ncbi:putative glycosyltransferase [Alicycliphilus sp. B1]|nr:putative glycosyltransferase [Alicycliphilus sp. B1]
MIGLVLPGAIFMLWCLATRRYRAMWLMAWPPGWMVFLGVAGPWFVAMQMRYSTFFDYFVVTQHFRRFAASGFNNEHPIWFYLPVIAGLTLPWFGWLLLAKRRTSGGWPKLSDVDWLMLIWGVVIVGFFSMPRSKLIGYVLPALPPLAYLIAKVAGAATARVSTSFDKLRWTGVVSGAICMVSVVLVGTLSAPPGAQLRLPIPMAVAPGDQVLMLDSYFYEIPFYWRLQQFVMVASTWNRASAKARDDWRKELYDAASFESAPTSAQLIELSDIQAELCVPHATWLIGPSNAFLSHPWIATVPVITYNTRAAVWRFNGDTTGNARCLEQATPPSALRPS